MMKIKKNKYVYDGTMPAFYANVCIKDFKMIILYLPL